MSSKTIKLSRKNKAKENFNGNQNSDSLENNTENESPRKNRLLKNLESNLSPKYIGISPSSEGKRSRYGRQQKYKEDVDFLPTDAVYSYQRRSRSLQQTPSRFRSTNNNIIKISPLPKFEKLSFYESPIEKLLNKNREMAARVTRSPNQEIRDQLMEMTKRTLFNSSDETSCVHDESVTMEEPKCEILDLSWSSIPDVLLLSPGNIDLVNMIEIDEIPELIDIVDESIENVNKESTMAENEINVNEEHVSVIEVIENDVENNETPVENNVKEFQTGDILWGKFGKFPYWPCIVCPNDKGVVSTGFGHVLKVHIRFFADMGRRSWITQSMCLPYQGLDDFNRMKIEALSQHKTAKRRHSKGSQNNGFYISASNLEKWEQAVNEADSVLCESIEDRLQAFEEILQKSVKKVVEDRKRRASLRKSIAMPRKRLRSPTPESPIYEPIVPSSKRIKTEDSVTYPSNLFSSTRLSDLSQSDNIEEDDNYMSVKYLASQEVNRKSEVTQVLDKFRQTILKKNENLRVDESGLNNFIDKMWTIKQVMLARGNGTRNKNLSQMDIKNGNGNLVNKVIKKDPEVSSNGSDETVSTSTRSPSPSPNTNMSDFTKNFLFRKLSKDFVCRICFKPTDLLKCEGICNGWYHRKCIPHTKSSSILSSNDENSTEFLCKDCRNDQKPPCFVCGQYSEPQNRMRCKFSACGRYYHEACLKYFPQAKIINLTSLSCPAHACHTCISDDPRGKYISSDHMSYVKCVKCPSSYHMDSGCIPAGTEFITAIQIICPKHRERVNINANWCFICANGGRLVCCETCPTAFHAECLNIPLPEDKSYICEECETGRMPLYGEIVWAKLGKYRWWPAQITPPPVIPQNMMRLTRKSSDFCVKFFGSNNYSWIDRGRVYLYQEGDWGRTKNSNAYEASYLKALTEAKQMWQLLNEQKLEKKSKEKTRYKPMPYVKLKANKPIPPVKLIEEVECDLPMCTCESGDPEPCGPDSKCINRLLMIECNPKVCPARDRCLNQMFQKRISPALEVKRTELRGWGLVVLEPIKSGTFVLEYVGEVIDSDEFRRRLEKKRKEMDENYYFLTLDSNLMIDAGPRGNVARFINHSCEPNCETQKWTVNGITRIGLFASVDIKENTELTFNYNWDCLGEQMKICHCGAGKCSGFIGAKYRNKDDAGKFKSLRGSTDSVGTSSSGAGAKGKKKTKPKKKPRKKMVILQQQQQTTTTGTEITNE